MKKFIWCSSHVTTGALKTFLSLKLKLPKFLTVLASELPSFLSTHRKALFISSYSTELQYYWPQIISGRAWNLGPTKMNPVLFIYLLFRWHNKSFVDQNRQIFSMQIRAPLFSKLSIPSMLFLLSTDQVKIVTLEISQEYSKNSVFWIVCLPISMTILESMFELTSSTA